VLQQVAFVFPAAAQVRRPAIDRLNAKRTPAKADAPKAPSASAALDDPGPPAIDRGTGSVSLTTPGTAYTQNFNTLSNTAGSTTNESLPTGWYITESGSGTRDNDQYAVDTGGSNTGDIFSYGAAGNTDRALGALQSGTLIPTIGAQFTNNTGGTITSLDIAYTGEQWRIGNTAAARDDRLDFQISTNATNLCGADSGPCVGTYTDVNALDFTNPIKTAASAAALDGNNAANRTAISTTIPSLSIPNGATFWIRWNDLNASGADDGLAIDDFSVTPQGTGGGGVSLSINDVSQDEGSGGGTTAYSFTVTVSASTHTGVTFDICTADGTAQDDNPATEDNDYTANCLTGQTIPGGSVTYPFTVQVNADSTTEANETFFVNVTNVVGATVADGQGQGTIVNDDISLVLIHDVQGNGAASPIPGATVTVRGVVTLLKSNGFFLQEETGDNDADPNTSEGIFVFTSSAPTVAVGDQATVTGTVVEFNGLTEISTPSITVNSTGNALPTAVTLTTTDLPPTANFAQPQLEKYEGMRLAAASLTTVGPNDSFFDVPTVITGVPRPTREPGIPASDPVPPDPTSGTPDPNIPIWDENPERLMLDTNGRAGSTGETLTSNVVITNVAGPLDFGFGQYRLINEAALTRTANMSAVAVPVPNASEFTVASYNIENFNNNATQRQKAALTVRTLLHYPDIIGAVEIFDLADLQALRDQINNDAVAAGDPNPLYEAYLVEADGTSEDSDQDVGFLVKTARVQFNSATQEREEETFVNPVNGQPETLHDRPPFVLDATVDPSGANPRRVLVVVNHLRSFIDIELVAGEGVRVREKRKKQAESLADLLNDLQAGNPGVPVISVGDYNAFEFNTGYDDPISVIKGNPTPDDQIVVDQSPDLVEPDFFNLTDEMPAAERYSFIFEHTAQGLDHHLVNAAARARNTRSAIARVNADFPEAPAAAFASDATRPERNSDHDPVVSYYSLGNAQASGSLIISEFRFHGANLGGDEVSPETGGGSDPPGGPSAPGTAAENDEFIEFYNNTDSDITVSTIDGSAGWALVAADGVVRFIIPNGTVIPARHHFLAANVDGYSLFDYGLPDAVLLPDGVTMAAGYDLNILDDSGIALFRTANPSFFTVDQRLDAVGYAAVPELYREGAGLTAGAEVGGEQEYSWLRQMCAFVQGVGCTTPGIPKDSGFNQNDFVSVDTTGVTQSLGAPGPEGLTSPVQRNADFPAALLDTARSAGAAPNRVRDLADTGVNKSFGTMSIRRTITNNTGGPVDYLTFRVVQITTFPVASPADADLRVLDSADIVVTLSNGTQVDVRGTYVELPAQPNGGALNSSLGVGYINLEGNTIEDGETVSVQFLLGVEKTGNFRFYINVEAYDDCTCPPTPELKDRKAQKAQPRASAQDAVKPKRRPARGRRR
jgi:predicted extracellular nuclease